MNHVWTQDDSTAFAELLISAGRGKSIIWDFDGVVADTEPLHDASYRVLGQRRKWTPSDDFFLSMVGQTEPIIWARLFASGLPVHSERASDVRDLIAARREVFLELAEQSLQPSWLCTALMPALHGVATTQVIVSNGDPTTIERLLRLWSMDQFVEVLRRASGTDKRLLLDERLSDRCVLLEDDARWLALGTAAGAVTVAVQHDYNRTADVHGDFTVTL